MRFMVGAGDPKSPGLLVDFCAYLHCQQMMSIACTSVIIEKLKFPTDSEKSLMSGSLCKGYLAPEGLKSLQTIKQLIHLKSHLVSYSRWNWLFMPKQNVSFSFRTHFAIGSFFTRLQSVFLSVPSTIYNLMAGITSLCSCPQNIHNIYC